MNGEIICVGTELLLGDIVNTNAQYISAALAELGCNVYTQAVVGDNPERLTAEISAAIKRSELVVITGGLGPTADDITRDIAAKVLEKPMHTDSGILNTIEDYFARSGRQTPKGAARQALVPEGAVVFPNDVGTAPGLAMEKDGCRVVLLPGPPKEMRTMFERYAKGYIEKLTNSVIHSENIKIYGIGEGEVANSLGEILDGSNPTVATYAKTAEVLVRVTASAKNPDEAKQLCSGTVFKIADIFKDCIYSFCGEELNEATVKLLKEKGLQVATAESCTAGLLSKKLTDVSGSSRVFQMGVSAYANEIKKKALSVPEAVLNEYGAVSKETAALMAKGVRELSGADIGVGITGVAGPEPSEGKPVGLVYIAATDGKVIWIRRLEHGKQNDREKIRENAAQAALDLIRRYAAAYPEALGGGAESDKPLAVFANAADFTLPKSAVLKPQLTSGSLKTDEGAFENTDSAANDNAKIATDNSEDDTAKSSETRAAVAAVGNDEKSADRKDAATKKTAAESCDIGNNAEKPADNDNEAIAENAADALQKSEKSPMTAADGKPEPPAENPDEYVLQTEQPEIYGKKHSRKKEKRKKNEPLSDYYLEADEAAAKENGLFVAEDKDYEGPTAEKPRFIKRVRNYLFPKKGDKPLEVIRKIVFLAALLTFIVTGIYLIRYYSQGRINEGLTEQARKTYNIAGDEVGKNGMLVRFDELYKQNSDIKGWIKIDGTKLDYPVYQTDNNDYYIDHDMSKKESRYGAVFADCDSKITSDGNSRNVVLYGHNMIDGSMFSTLLNYKDIEFYKKKPLITFNSVYDTAMYKVFAVIVTNADKKDDDGYVFNYRQSAFSSDNNFLYWIQNVRVRSVIDTGEEILPTDEILTLSTCSYEFDDARTVVFCRKVRSGETLYSGTSKAKVNKNPLYPQAYYDKNGGKKPDVDLSYYSANSSSAERITAQKVEGYTENDESYTADNITENESKKNVTVGSYVGLSLSGAVYKINDDGLYITDIEYDGDDKNRNDVLKQSLKAGETVPEGTGITLKVSGIPAKIVVPKFVGKTLSRAQKDASVAGMTVNIIMMSSKKPKDTVLLQSVAPKTETAERMIVLYVSNGRNKVPKLVGLKTDDAKKKLEDEGFTVKTVKIETVDKKQIGVVCSQSVKEGEYYDVGKKVTVYVGEKKKKGSSSKNSSSKVSSSKTTSSKAASSKASSSKTASSKTDSSKVTSSKTDSSAASSSSVTESRTPHTSSQTAASSSES